MSSGYSGTPLAKKLSIKDGHRVWWHAIPKSVRREIEASGIPFRRIARLTRSVDVAHVFVDRQTELKRLLERLRNRIAQDGMIWVSWPKKASKKPTDITEDDIRTLAFPLGLVDIKVCAVDQIWSGLKLVIRKELRK